jgi:hypothetical protein
MVDTRHDRAKWARIADFQANIARVWLDLYTRSEEPAFRFVAAFSAFNAVYWTLSSVAASQRGNRNIYGELKLPPERECIDALVERMDDQDRELLLSNDASVALIALFQRRAPLKDMRRRERSEEGDGASGAEEQEHLAPERPALERLTALARLLYQVRCNLVHGAKAVSGSASDEELLRAAAPAMLLLAESAVQTLEHSRAD